MEKAQLGRGRRSWKWARLDARDAHGISCASIHLCGRVLTDLHLLGQVPVHNYLSHLQDGLDDISG